MAGIRVDIRSGETQQLLRELSRRTADMNEVKHGVGAILASSTQQRFEDQVGPDALPWKQLSATTLAKRRKNGRGAKILRDTGRLAGSITHKIVGKNIELGTNVVYAGTHQFGARKGQYGRGRKGGPIPWGDVPARPFFGYNAEDADNVNELLRRYIDVSQPQSFWQRFIAGFRRLFR